MQPRSRHFANGLVLISFVRSETDFSQDRISTIGYLSTIVSPATNMSIVFEVLRQSVYDKGKPQVKISSSSV